MANTTSGGVLVISQVRGCAGTAAMHLGLSGAGSSGYFPWWRGEWSGEGVTVVDTSDAGAPDACGLAVVHTAHIVTPRVVVSLTEGELLWGAGFAGDAVAVTEWRVCRWPECAAAEACDVRFGMGACGAETVPGAGDNWAGEMGAVLDREDAPGPRDVTAVVATVVPLARYSAPLASWEERCRVAPVHAPAGEAAEAVCRRAHLPHWGLVLLTAGPDGKLFEEWNRFREEWVERGSLLLAAAVRAAVLRLVKLESR